MFKCKVAILPIFALLMQVWTLDLQESLVAPYANMLQQNFASAQLAQQINGSMESIVQTMATYNDYVANITSQILAEHSENIQKKMMEFKTNIANTQKRSIIIINDTNVVVKCIIEEAKLDVLAEEVNNEIKTCATVAMAEMVNVISDSVRDAQTFMSIPNVIGTDIQRCGLSYNCRWDIIGDAIAESLQVPPKVFALVAKIQSIALRTVVSVNGCGLQGFRNITELSLSLLQDIFVCISDEIDDLVNKLNQRDTTTESITDATTTDATTTDATPTAWT